MNRMKKILYFLSILTSFAALSSCATIAGGSRYYAHVKVQDHPNAKIEYNEVVKGTGDAVFKTKRAQSNKFSLNIKEEGCEDETFNFTRRTFRGWAFAGTVVTWTGLIGNIPLPWGVVVDLSTGALWKPNINEKGVSKIDYKHFNYLIDYKGCKNSSE